MNVPMPLGAVVLALACALTSGCASPGADRATATAGDAFDVVSFGGDAAGDALTDAATVGTDTLGSRDSGSALDGDGAIDAGDTGTDPDPDAGPDVPRASRVGCSDGSREGFGDLGRFPAIAACGGAWDVPGLFAKPASCDRKAGNTGANAAGVGCSVTDLCAEGWAVCLGREKVMQAAGGCAGVMVGATSPVFFTTQMSSTGAFECATGAAATNDLFGCGDLGCDFTDNPTVADLCAPLVMSSHDLCKGLRNDLGCGDWCNHLGKYPALGNAWSCGSDGSSEALNVTKSLPDQQGGVLCCRL